MSLWLLALAAGIVLAIVQYGARMLSGGALSLAAAMLRAAAVTLIVALLLDAPAGCAKPVATWAALDASLSMTRGDSSLWRAARDSVRAAKPDSAFVFGDSVRPEGASPVARDQSSALRPAVERALGAGHPLLVVTDGELDDPDAARGLPAGSRVLVLKRPPQRDLAVVSIDVPRAVVSGDTVQATVTVAAGGAGAAGGSLDLALGDKPLVREPVAPLPAYGEHAIAVKVRVDAPAGPNLLRAVVASPQDAEPRNDTLSVAIEVSRAASAVFVSTSPDFDARYALAVLRGSLGIPARGFFRVAPGEWRIEGPLTPVPESEVRQAIHDAPVVIIHGDTAAFGPPRSVTQGPLALIVTSGTDGEWYPSAAPMSPLAPELSGLAWDSLPPVGIVSTPPAGSWTGIEARRGRGDERKPVVVGTDEPRRVAIVAASGLWRWQFRGGVASDAFTAFWGSIFDWLAAERTDRRAAVVDDRLVRAGDPVRWRRGSPQDSVVALTLRQRGTGRIDSLTLRFPSNSNIVETKPLPVGIYEISTRGGSALLAVNESREWLPRAPRVSALGGGTVLSADATPRLRVFGWAYALAILLLCAEWILRRTRGMR
ncbi:MAG TPA: hypothetical protein VFR50_13480 [Casimicrobiaceae bacterium]|nr:hypothetical protein [Casimicrobiaceae bacterium]